MGFHHFSFHLGAKSFLHHKGRFFTQKTFSLYIFLLYAENTEGTTIEGGITVNHQSNQQQQHTGTDMPLALQFGAHELLDADEAIGTLVGAIEHFVLYDQYVQDTQLKNMMQRHKTAITQIYNTILDTLKSGKDPAVKTQTYMMEIQNTQTRFGMQPSSPKTPIQSVNEFNDECISSAILGHIKAIASEFTLTALEATNPVLRRIFADSIPNIIEMGFEIYLYQNEHQYYEVPQLNQQDMQNIVNSFGQANNNMSH